MASERQLAANRRNGLNGGPKTEAGKQRSRLNSLQHGLTSSTLVVLPEENQHEYEEVLRGFRESFQPHDAAEDALVLRLAQAHWRSLRSRRVETGILNTTAAVQRGRAREIVEDCPEHLNLHNAIAVGFMTMPAEHWQMYLRYDTTISRDFFRTLARGFSVSVSARPASHRIRRRYPLWFSPPEAQRNMCTNRNCPIPGLGPFRRMTLPILAAPQPVKAKRKDVNSQLQPYPQKGWKGESKAVWRKASACSDRRSRRSCGANAPLL